MSTQAGELQCQLAGRFGAATHVGKRRSAGIMFVVAVLLLALDASTARASIPPPVSENIDSVVQFYKYEVMAGGGACDAVCDALVKDAQKPSTNRPGACRQAGQLFRSAVDKAVTTVREALKSPKTLARAGVVVVLGVANYRVWRYKVWGAHPRTGVIRTPAGPAEVWQWRFFDGVDTSMFFTYHELPSQPPVGYIAEHRYRAGVLWQTSATNSACNEVAPTPPAGLEGFFQEITWWWNACSPGQYDANGNPITVPLTAHTWSIPLSVIFGSFGSGEQPPPDAPTVDIIPDTLTTEEIRKRIEDVLNAPGSDYNDLRDWLDSVLGGGSENPRYEYRAVASCAERCPG